jgi:hypothetical protein
MQTDGIMRFALTRILTLLQIFEKRSLESGSRRERGASKADTDRVYEMLKKEVCVVEDG